MDVLAMHQVGFTNCVAPLGTALTEQQVRLLKRYASKAVLLFDGDAAGQKATARAIELLEGQDLMVQTAVVPGGQDPADLVQKGEVEQLRVLLDHPQESFPYLLAKALSEHDRAHAEGREAIRDYLFPFIAAPASQMRRDGYLSLLADTLEADVQAVRDDFSGWRSRRRLGPSRQPLQAGAGVRPGATGEPSAEKEITPDLFLMLAVALNRDLFPLVRNGGIASDLDDKRARDLYVALEEAYRAEEKEFESLCARLDDPALRDLAIRKAASGEFDMNQERMVTDGVRRIRERSLRKRIEGLSAEMRKTEKESHDPSRINELLAEKMHLDSELERLKTRAAGA
jgi:DNA primase